MPLGARTPCCAHAEKLTQHLLVAACPWASIPSEAVSDGPAPPAVENNTQSTSKRSYSARDLRKVRLDAEGTTEPDAIHLEGDCC